VAITPHSKFRSVIICGIYLLIWIDFNFGKFKEIKQTIY